MNKTLLTTALLTTSLLSGAALAHKNNSHEQTGNFHISSDNCNLDFNNAVTIDSDTVEIKTSNNQTMKIKQDGSLIINGEHLSLNQSQQDAAQEYANGLRTELPQVAEIALEGVKIAGTALDEVATAFNLNDMNSLSDVMDDLAVKIEDSFYQGDTFVIDNNNFNAIDDAFGEEFESQMEQAMEAAVMDSIGSILIALGSELLGSGGDMQEFERRMEHMGQQIEEKVEVQAKNLEVKAKALCNSMELLADQEDRLQAFFPELVTYDLFAVNQ